MHDMIREMAPWIACGKKKPEYLVEARTQLVKLCTRYSYIIVKKKMFEILVSHLQLFTFLLFFLFIRKIQWVFFFYDIRSQPAESINLMYFETWCKLSF